MKLAYNFNKTHWEVFPESTKNDEAFYAFTKNNNSYENDLIAIFEINHWTEDDIIAFDDLMCEDQVAILENLTAVFTTEK